MLPMAQRAPIAPAPVRWHRSPLAETDASDHASAACYRLIKNGGIVPIVISELKLGDVQRHVLGADFVEHADHAAFEDRPEALNRVRVNRADDVFVSRVPYDFVLRKFAVQGVVSPQVVGGEQTDLVGNRLADEAGRSTRSKLSMTRATTLPLRCTAPITAVLPEPVPPLPPSRLSQCLLRAFPPT